MRAMPVNRRILRRHVLRAAHQRLGKGRGFTLIELLVVFTLLALLLTIAVPRYLQSAESAKEKARDQNVATLRDALDKFRADQGRYPNELSELVAKQYLRRIPVDPVTASINWIPVADATGKEAGVYDVTPPEVTQATPTSATTTTTDPVVPVPAAPEVKLAN